eukprot:m.64727 g.64727  ORF g.64727 m.64727 type:complete len:119 (-) comp49740_c0_seq1:94-450(-)
MNAVASLLPSALLVPCPCLPRACLPASCSDLVGEKVKFNSFNLRKAMLIFTQFDVETNTRAVHCVVSLPHALASRSCLMPLPHAPAFSRILCVRATFRASVAQRFLFFFFCSQAGWQR